MTQADSRTIIADGGVVVDRIAIGILQQIQVVTRVPSAPISLVADIDLPAMIVLPSIWVITDLKLITQTVIFSRLCDITRIAKIPGWTAR